MVSPLPAPASPHPRPVTAVEPHSSSQCAGLPAVSDALCCSGPAAAPPPGACALMLCRPLEATCLLLAFLTLLHKSLHVLICRFIIIICFSLRTETESCASPSLIPAGISMGTEFSTNTKYLLKHSLRWHLCQSVGQQVAGRP